MDKKLSDLLFEFTNIPNKSLQNKTFRISEEQAKYINNASKLMNREKQFTLFCLIKLGSEKLNEMLKNQ
jgi:hypothetical protein